MEQIKRKTHTNTGRFVSLHDSRISAIVCNENSVEFHFENGFTVVDGNDVTYTKKGYVKLSDCNCDEFSCYLIKRKSSPKGLRFCGKQISLIELEKMLSKKKKSVEVYIELYDDNFLYWRGELYPYKKRGLHGLNDSVVIETMDDFPMTYYWEE